MLVPSDKLQPLQLRNRVGPIFLPNSRYVNSYVLSGKLLNSLDAVGFSLNPEHCESVDWSRILRENVKIIVLERRNVVKTAVSGETVSY